MNSKENIEYVINLHDGSTLNVKHDMNSKKSKNRKMHLIDGRMLEVNDDDVFGTHLMLDGEKFIPAFYYYIKCSEIDDQSDRFGKTIIENRVLELRNHKLINEVDILRKRIATLEKENVEIENKYQALDKIMVDIVAKYIGSST